MKQHLSDTFPKGSIVKFRENKDINGTSIGVSKTGTVLGWDTPMKAVLVSLRKEETKTRWMSPENLILEESPSQRQQNAKWTEVALGKRQSNRYGNKLYDPSMECKDGVKFTPHPHYEQDIPQ